MALIQVNFEYLTGLRRPLITTARLTGNWDAQGRRSEQWTETPMTAFTAADGCPAFRATVNLDDSQIGQDFRWGVYVNTPQSANVWGIPTEVNDPASRERYRTFTLRQARQTERYYLTHCRRLGGNKLFSIGGTPPATRFAVWAPNARNVELVRGEPVGGYIYNNGEGIRSIIPMHPVEDGIWTTDVADAAELSQFCEL